MLVEVSVCVCGGGGQFCIHLSLSLLHTNPLFNIYSIYVIVFLFTFILPLRTSAVIVTGALTAVLSCSHPIHPVLTYIIETLKLCVSVSLGLAQQPSCWHTLCY